MKILPTQASTVATQVDLLMAALLLLCGAVTLGIFATLGWFCWKYRRGSPADRSRRAGKIFSTTLELGWTFVPLVIFMGIFAWSTVLYYRMQDAPPEARVIYVVGKQWMWKAQHVSGRSEINELHVPLGQPVRLVLTSQDVIHDFYVPAFRIKMDVLPGRYTSEWFEATRSGRYQIFCSQYCGTMHARMVGTVVVMPPAEFAAWLSSGLPDVPALASDVFSDKRPQEAPLGALALEGAQIFDKMQCAACHGNADTAPPLARIFGTQVEFEDGSRATVDEAYLYESIVRPQARIVKGYTPVMPSYEGNLTSEQVNALVEFIRSQR